MPKVRFTIRIIMIAVAATAVVLAFVRFLTGGISDTFLVCILWAFLLNLAVSWVISCVSKAVGPVLAEIQSPNARPEPHQSREAERV
jgi:hypothetical protein